jgi:hypothetical protein
MKTWVCDAHSCSDLLTDRYIPSIATPLNNTIESNRISCHTLISFFSPPKSNLNHRLALCEAFRQNPPNETHQKLRVSHQGGSAHQSLVIPPHLNSICGRWFENREPIRGFTNHFHWLVW